MRFKFGNRLRLGFALLASVVAMSPYMQTLNALAQKQSDEEVLRISVDLVQVDATVTDKDGREVTNLNQGDFDVLVNGRSQNVTNFSYIPPIPLSESTEPGPARAIPPRSTALQPNQVRRTIAMVVDDLGLSSISMSDVKKALKHFVTTEMAPNDMVAVLRTGEGAGFLQQFTSDKRALEVAIERLRWNPNSRGGIFAGSSSLWQRAWVEDRPIEDADPEQQRMTFYTLGSIGALKFIVRGLAEMPGRKSVLFFSDGIRLFAMKDGEEDVLTSTTRTWQVLDPRVRDATRDLTREANRASVVVHSIEARGPQTMGGKVEDMLKPGLNSQAFYADQEGLGFLADETGGMFAQSNDLNVAVTRVMHEPRGYYLIGFKPDQDWAKSKAGSTPAPKVELKLKPPGLKLRYRKGFFGPLQSEAKTVPTTAGQKLFAALMSPFAAADIGVRLTSVFGHDKKEGSFVRSWVYIDAGALTFEKANDGQLSASVVLTAVTFAEGGQMIEPVDRVFTIEARPEELTAIKRGGFVYEITVPVTKAGAYQLRVAVQDRETQMVGSASQFVEVPDVTRDQLSLSGIVIGGIEKASSSTASAQTRPLEAQTNSALRRFKRGMQLNYVLMVFNAKSNQGGPQLETQIALYRDGKAIYKGAARPVTAKPESDPRQIVASGSLTLGADIAPGEYSLQVAVSDKLAKKKQQTVDQWVNFEVVK